MPRAYRYFLPGYVYHITHRCHNCAFLLRFAKDRDAYQEWLRKGALRYKVSILGYCITCNHVHLILFQHNDGDLSKFMQLIEGRAAQQYNLRKGRKGAFWQDRYHCTIIDSGLHLWNCLQYVDLNMVRAGRVKNPEQWKWCGYGEFIGLRKRYRLLDMETILDKMGYDDLEKTRKHYKEEIERRLSSEVFERDPVWTESLAVGEKSFIDSLQKQFPRVRLYINEEKTADGKNEWSIREAPTAYSHFWRVKSAPKAIKKT